MSIFKNWLEVDYLAESFLFKSLLKYLTADTQLCLLLIRPKKAIGLLYFENYFKSLELRDFNNISLSASLNEDNTTIQRFLWFIAPHAEKITTDMLNEYIAPISRYDESFTRASSLKVIYKSKNKDVIQKLIECGWQ